MKVKRRHIVITGTGRAGTTFLVQLFSVLGFDVGKENQKETMFDENTKCCPGATSIRNDTPYIVKSPRFCDFAHKVFARKHIIIERILVPIRDLYDAAESRRYIQRTFGRNAHGSLWDTKVPEAQENVLTQKIYKLMYAASETHIPITLMNFPMIIYDSVYLYEKLALKNIPFGDFTLAFNNVVRPEWVHTFKEQQKV